MRAAVLVVLALAAVGVASPSASAQGLDARADLALAYLAERAPVAGTLASNLAEAAHANGRDPGAWPSPSDPITARIEVPGPAASNVSLLRPLRALALAGDDRAGPGSELTLRVLQRFRDDGYGDPAAHNDDAYAALALRAAGAPSDGRQLQAARAHLLASQGADGGWGWAVGAPSGTDMTGLVLAALAQTGGIPGATADAAWRFLEAARSGAGGFPETPGGTRTCESTVWGLRATARLGQALGDADWAFLLGLQRPDGGFAHVAGGPADLLCTAEASTLLGEARGGTVPAPDATRRGLPAGGASTAAAGLLLAAAIVARSRRLRHP